MTPEMSTGEADKAPRKRQKTMRLWTAYEAAAATGGALCARGNGADNWLAEEWSVSGISIDSRTIEPGDLFVALKDARDGHDFVASAFAKGAAAALVSRAPSETPEGKPLLIVDDTLEALRDLAVAARMRNFGKRIAITGSSGKTSTKELAATVLSTFGRTHAAKRSFNNHIGAPLTLARMPAASDFSVFELGMNHAGEISPLSELVVPHAAIITTVGEAHLENLGSIENIAKAKAEIFHGLLPGGVAVLPIDNQHYDILLKRAKHAHAKVVTFGESGEADYQLIQYESDGNNARVTAQLKDTSVEFILGVPGKHQAMNALAMLAALDAVDVSSTTAVGRLAACAAADGRGAQLDLDLGDGRAIILLDESYNANPSSVRAALSLLSEKTPARDGRRIVVLGDMLELGPDAKALHAGLADSVIASGAAKVYVAGHLVGDLWEALPEAMRGGKADEAAALTAQILSEVRNGDIIMAKGSNASKVSAFVEKLKLHAKTKPQ